MWDFADAHTRSLSRCCSAATTWQAATLEAHDCTTSTRRPRVQASCPRGKPCTLETKENHSKFANKFDFRKWPWILCWFEIIVIGLPGSFFIVTFIPTTDWWYQPLTGKFIVCTYCKWNGIDLSIWPLPGQFWCLFYRFHLAQSFPIGRQLLTWIWKTSMIQKAIQLDMMQHGSTLSKILHESKERAS